MTAPRHGVLVVSRHIDASTRRALSERFDAHFLPDAANPDAVITELAPRLRALVTEGHTGADAALMDRLPQLKLIACYGAGYDGIDVAAARKRGIAVTHTPDVLSDEVANFTIGMLIASSREIVAADRYVRSGRWVEAPYPMTRSIIGNTVGILGLGRIGQAIAMRCAVMGAKIIYSGTRPNPAVTYDYAPTPVELAARCDYLILCCALNAQTHHIVDARVLAALGKDGTLINIARGPVVDEAALVAALRDGTIAAAALDVFDQEPTAAAAFRNMHNVILLPHMASGTADTRAAIGNLVMDNLEAFFAEKPLRTPVP